MKKLLCFGIIVTTLGCLALSGCNRDKINYMAEKPVFRYTYEAWKNREELEEGEMGWTLNGCEPIANFGFYTEFSEYYTANLKEDETYLLYRDNETPPLTPYDEGQFAFYREKESGKLILNESYDYYDSELGTRPYKGKVPYYPYSLHMDVYIKAIGKTDLNGLELEFGKLKDRYFGYDKYLNVYAEGECFATCYFTNQVTVSGEWFENYFKKYLIYSDEI